MPELLWWLRMVRRVEKDYEAMRVAEPMKLTESST